MDMQALWESGQLSWDENDMLVLTPAPKVRKTKSVHLGKVKVESK